VVPALGRAVTASESVSSTAGKPHPGGSPAGPVPSTPALFPRHVCVERRVTPRFLSVILALGPQNAVRESLAKQSWQTFKRAVQNFNTQLEDCRKHTLRCETGDCTLKGNFKHLAVSPCDGAITLPVGI
jgi:hypothetical protein